jgi:hypothetical protein
MRQPTGKPLLSKRQRQRPTANRADCNRLRDILSRLPPNFGKHSGKKQPLEKLAEANKTGPTLAWETQNNYLRMADNLFGWMVKERLIADNPATGISPLRRREAAEMQRLPFNNEELKSIFSMPVYTGCIDDEHGFAKAGTHVIRRSRYWVPASEPARDRYRLSVVQHHAPQSGF